jgi:hypothetical protein
MKKRIIFLILTVVLTLVIGGCTSDSDTKEEIEITRIEVEEKVIQDNESDEEIRTNFDKEKITGEISKIVGNIVTLEVYEIPERSGDGNGTGENKDETTEANPLVGATAQTTGQGGMKSGGGSKMTSFEKSGETKEVIIPVGISIKSSTDPDMSYEIENLVRGMSIMVVIDTELTDAQEKSDNEINYTYASSVNIIIN